jgi:hypothetical protein
MQYGIGQRPCAFFDGDDFLFSSTCPFAATTNHTVMIAYEMLGEEPAAQQSFLVVSEAADPNDSYFQFSVSTADRTQMTYKSFDAVIGNGERGSTTVNDKLPHVGVWTHNAANTAYEHYLDGVSEVMQDANTGSKGISFNGVTGADVFSVGGFSFNGLNATMTLYGKIAHLAIWTNLL